MSDAPLTSTDFLRLAQQSTGRRQKAYFSLVQLSMMLEAGENLRDDQKATLRNVMQDLQNAIPEARKAR